MQKPFWTQLPRKDGSSSKYPGGLNKTTFLWKATMSASWGRTWLADPWPDKPGTHVHGHQRDAAALP